jgi:hypothetical protein
MQSRTCARPELSVLGWRLGMSGLTATKFNDCMKVITIRCVSLSDRAQRHDQLGRPARRFSGIRPPSPGFKKGLKAPTAPYDLSARCVNA